MRYVIILDIHTEYYITPKLFRNWKHLLEVVSGVHSNSKRVVSHGKTALNSCCLGSVQ